MSRKSLISDINQLDANLTLHRRQLAITTRQAKQTLGGYQPRWLIAGGLLSGAVVGALGWKGVYAAGLAGFRLFPVVTGGLAWFSAMEQDA